MSVVSISILIEHFTKLVEHPYFLLKHNPLTYTSGLQCIICYLLRPDKQQLVSYLF